MVAKRFLEASLTPQKSVDFEQKEEVAPMPPIGGSQASIRRDGLELSLTEALRQGIRVVSVG